MTPKDYNRIYRDVVRWADSTKQMRSRSTNKLGIKDVTIIKKLLSEGRKQIDIASMYHVDKSLISLIKNNKIWI